MAKEEKERIEDVQKEIANLIGAGNSRGTIVSNIAAVGVEIARHIGNLKDEDKLLIKNILHKVAAVL